MPLWGWARRGKLREALVEQREEKLLKGMARRGEKGGREERAGREGVETTAGRRVGERRDKGAMLGGMMWCEMQTDMAGTHEVGHMLVPCMSM